MNNNSINKIFLKDLKNYINKAGLGGQLQVEESLVMHDENSWDDEG